MKNKDEKSWAVENPVRKWVLVIISLGCSFFVTNVLVNVFLDASTKKGSYSLIVILSSLVFFALIIFARMSNRPAFPRSDEFGIGLDVEVAGKASSFIAISTDISRFALKVGQHSLELGRMLDPKLTEEKIVDQSTRGEFSNNELPIIVAGLSGSGKSTLIRKVTETINSIAPEVVMVVHSMDLAVYANATMNSEVGVKHFLRFLEEQDDEESIKRQRILVIDQFEQLATYGYDFLPDSEKIKKILREFLGAEEILLIIVVRSDYLLRMEEYLDLFPRPVEFYWCRGFNVGFLRELELSRLVKNALLKLIPYEESRPSVALKKAVQYLEEQYRTIEMGVVQRNDLDKRSITRVARQFMENFSFLREDLQRAILNDLSYSGYFVEGRFVAGRKHGTVLPIDYQLVGLMFHYLTSEESQLPEKIRKSKWYRRYRLKRFRIDKKYFSSEDYINTIGGHKGMAEQYFRAMIESSGDDSLVEAILVVISSTSRFGNLWSMREISRITKYHERRIQYALDELVGFKLLRQIRDYGSYNDERLYSWCHERLGELFSDFAVKNIDSAYLDSLSYRVGVHQRNSNKLEKLDDENVAPEKSKASLFYKCAPGVGAWLGVYVVIVSSVLFGNVYYYYDYNFLQGVEKYFRWVSVATIGEVVNKDDLSEVVDLEKKIYFLFGSTHILGGLFVYRTLLVPMNFVGRCWPFVRWITFLVAGVGGIYLVWLSILYPRTWLFSIAIESLIMFAILFLLGRLIWFDDGFRKIGKEWTRLKYKFFAFGVVGALIGLYLAKYDKDIVGFESFLAVIAAAIWTYSSIREYAGERKIRSVLNYIGGNRISRTDADVRDYPAALLNGVGRFVDSLLRARS